MAALLFGAGCDEASLACAALSQDLIELPSDGVPLDQPLTVLCNVNYQLNMSKFPGLEAELNGEVVPQLALQVSATEGLLNHTKEEMVNTEENGKYYTVNLSNI